MKRLKESNTLAKYKPSVARRFLWLVAGLLWSAVGVGLCAAAVYWLMDAPWPANLLGAGVGLGAGAVIYRFGFSRIARKNIARIAQKPEKVCIFAFQAWKSYVLIVVMMALGFALRHSALPRLALASLYMAIGSGLGLSSILYYAQLM